MNDGAYDFDEQLKFGNEWESEAKKHLQELFTAVSVSNISYDENPDLQRAGIDVLFQQSETSIDIKTQRYEHTQSPNLPIEVLSVMEESVPGWFYESDSDLVVWIYPNKAKTNLHPVGYLMPLTDGLRTWFDDEAERFEFKSIRNNGRYGEYSTGCRMVPIEEFPAEYLVEFDPRLPTERETPQSDIMQWASEDENDKIGQVGIDDFAAADGGGEP